MVATFKGSKSQSKNVIKNITNLATTEGQAVSHFYGTISEYWETQGTLHPFMTSMTLLSLSLGIMFAGGELNSVDNLDKGWLLPSILIGTPLLVLPIFNSLKLGHVVDHLCADPAEYANTLAGKRGNVISGLFKLIASDVHETALVPLQHMFTSLRQELEHHFGILCAGLGGLFILLKVNGVDSFLDVSEFAIFSLFFIPIGMMGVQDLIMGITGMANKKQQSKSSSNTVAGRMASRLTGIVSDSGNLSQRVQSRLQGLSNRASGKALNNPQSMKMTINV